MMFGMFWAARNGHALVEDCDFVVHETEEEYRSKAQEYLDSEQLGDFREDAFLFNKRQRGLVPSRLPYADEVDRAAVVRILRGRDHYLTQYALGGPSDPRTGEPYSKYSADYRHWAAQQSKPVLDPDQAALIEHIDFGFRSHDAARGLLCEGVGHGVVRTHYCDILCQARLDWFNPKRGIVLVTTCDKLRHVESQLRHSGPTHRLAFERSVVAQVIGQNMPTHIVAVEKSLPHRCGVWQLSDRLLRRAQRENEKAIAQFAACRQLDRWPTGYESIRTLNPSIF